MLGSTTQVLAGDAAAGEKKAYTCLGCHGVLHYVNTYPTYHVPKLGGQHKDYLIDALKAYRAKTRSHVTMQANANLLSDEDMPAEMQKRAAPQLKSLVVATAMVQMAIQPFRPTRYWPVNMKVFWCRR